MNEERPEIVCPMCKSTMLNGTAFCHKCGLTRKGANRIAALEARLAETEKALKIFGGAAAAAIDKIREAK